MPESLLRLRWLGWLGEVSLLTAVLTGFAVIRSASEQDGANPADYRHEVLDACEEGLACYRTSASRLFENPKNYRYANWRERGPSDSLEYGGFRKLSTSARYRTVVR